MISNSYDVQKIVFFLNAEWRNLLVSICRKIDDSKLGMQVISPCGFELLEDTRFLFKSIKRLYCYIGVPDKKMSASSALEIANRFAFELMSALPVSGMQREDIAILAIQEKINLLRENGYQCQPQDKLIDVQVRLVEDNILRDYANYIICAIDSILSKKEEPAHFFENKRHRCRTYQLYVMLETLFGYLLPSMSLLQKERFRSIFKKIDNSIQMFYTPSEIYVNASSDDIYLLNSLMLPRIQHIGRAVKGDYTDLLSITCDAYHVLGELKLVIDRNIYKQAVSKIEATYMNFV